MKNNSLLKISSNTSLRKSKAAEKPAATPSLAGIEQDINRLYEMYQAQLKRNTELMLIIDRQQQIIQQAITKSAITDLAPASQPSLESQPILLPEYKDLSVEALNQFTNTFKELFSKEVKRLDGIHGIIRLLYTLNHVGGTALSDLLFSKIKVGQSTGFRIISFLKKKQLIRATRESFDTKYQITKFGRQFLEGTLKAGYTEPLTTFSRKERKPAPTLDLTNPRFIPNA